MMLTPCPHEIELRALISRGQWPQASAQELRDHVAACRSCSDLALVAEAFQRSRAATIAAAKPVSPGVLFWRAQLRRRNAAIERLTRPLLGAQIFALAVISLSGIAFLAFEARNGVAWLTWLEQLPQGAAQQWQELLSSSLAAPGWGWMILVPVAATLALFTGVAIYFAADKQ